MPSRKQQRRRQKLKRHEYEEVYVDEEGNELAPEVAEELVAASPAKNGKPARAQPTRRGGRAIEPPSWRRTGRRGLLFFPLMLLTVFLLAGDNVTTLGKIVQTIALMAFFLPFSYFMDTMVWRAAQRRLAKADEPKKKS
jgi:cytochrome c-type biogenesis protein CcmH/NrfG